MDSNPEPHTTDKTEDWSRLLKSKYKKELAEISREYPHRRSLTIDYRDVERFGKTGMLLQMSCWKIPEKSSKMSGKRSKKAS
jgi:replicative DNA helicase Mcm